MKKLLSIVSALSAPKNQKNSFGNYYYRSCEDILEAVKPLLAEHECTIILGDEIVEVGGRVYVKATVFLVDAETQETIGESTAYAREPLTKKGMDESQITGAASSYARKYALNGLLCIDDNKDSDTDHYKNIQNKLDKSTEELGNIVPGSIVSLLTDIDNLLNDKKSTLNDDEYKVYKYALDNRGKMDEEAELRGITALNGILKKLNG